MAQDNLLLRIISLIMDEFMPKGTMNKVLWGHLEQSLQAYPSLQSAFPAGWPRSKKFKVTHKDSKKFFTDRQTGYEEGMNIILALHNSNPKVAWEGTQAWIQSILSELDWFAREMTALPGGKSILKPLWTDSSNPLRFWSVVSEVYYTRLLVNQGSKIEGFDRTITDSTTTADILTRTPDGKRIWIDIEALSCTKTPESSESFRKAHCGKSSKEIIL